MLDAWLTVDAWLLDDAPGPALPELSRTWASLLPAGAPDLDELESIERFADWLTLAEMLAQHRSEQLHRFRFRDESPILNAFMDAVDDVVDSPGRIDPAAAEHVVRALDALARLTPQLADLSGYFTSRLRTAGLPPVPTVTESSLPHEERPGWRTFDIARVLEDL